MVVALCGAWQLANDLVRRQAESLAAEALDDTRVVLINGARQAGKSTLTRLYRRAPARCPAVRVRPRYRWRAEQQVHVSASKTASKDADVAAKLSLQEAAVRSHVYCLCEKLAPRARAQLVVCACQSGFTMPSLLDAWSPRGRTPGARGGPLVVSGAGEDLDERPEQAGAVG